MHELLLFGQVSASRHAQVLHILAGVAAMQPVPILETHLVFKPHPRSPTAAAAAARPAHQQQTPQVGAGNPPLQALQTQIQGDMFYLKVVGEGGGGGGGEEKGVVNDDKPSQTWTLQFRDLPEVAGRRPVTSRLMADVQILGGEPMPFMAALEYTHISTFLLSGHRLTNNSTSLLLSRVLLPSSPSSSPLNPSTINDPSSARLLDPSGTYILQAALRVQDGAKPELMSRGITELLAVKEVLKGVVEMGVGERLSLDTRVR